MARRTKVPAGDDGTATSVSPQRGVHLSSNCVGSGTRPIVGDVTPSMAQFLEIKAANPDCILWYRM
jgi:hypothetical protein